MVAAVSAANAQSAIIPALQLLYLQNLPQFSQYSPIAHGRTATKAKNSPFVVVVFVVVKCPAHRWAMRFSAGGTFAISAMRFSAFANDFPRSRRRLSGCQSQSVVSPPPPPTLILFVIFLPQ